MPANQNTTCCTELVPQYPSITEHNATTTNNEPIILPVGCIGVEANTLDEAVAKVAELLHAELGVSSVRFGFNQVPSMPSAYGGICQITVE